MLKDIAVTLNGFFSEYSIPLLVYLAAINLVTFFAYWLDKRKAKSGAWRTPEATLIALAALGGSPAALAAMQLFRHKTKHAKFAVGVPVILILQAAFALFILVYGAA